MNYRIVTALCAVVLAFFIARAPASASTQAIAHGGTYWGNVVVEPDQVVDGDVTVFFGNATIEGIVRGDVTTFFGNIDQRTGSTITGDTNTFGGTDYTQAIVPWMPSTLAAENAGMMLRLAESVVVLLVFLIFPVRVRMALERVEKHPGLSAAVGVLAFVAVIPIALLLLVSFVGWPLIPLEIVALIAGIFIGQAALGLLVGRRLYELIHPETTPSPLAALIIGLVVLSAAQIVPVVGHLVTALVVLIGLGAAILAFIREGLFMGQPPIPRAPIGGPPMSVA